MPKVSNRLFCFLGSTIGNFTTDEVEKFMTLLGEEMQEGDSLLMGMDMIKDISTIEKAYNDSRGITALFNKNILNVVNSLIGSNFNPDYFEHVAFYNKKVDRIEMHLKAQQNMVVAFNEIADIISFKKGETIHTENSHKFNNMSIETIGYWAGLNVQKIVDDDKKWFSLVHYKK